MVVHKECIMKAQDMTGGTISLPVQPIIIL